MSSVSSAANSVMQAQQASLGSQVQMSVMAKQLQAQKQTGAAMNELLEAVVELSKEAGKGTQFDAVG